MLQQIPWRILQRLHPGVKGLVRNALRISRRAPDVLHEFHADRQEHVHPPVGNPDVLVADRHRGRVAVGAVARKEAEGAGGPQLDAALHPEEPFLELEQPLRARRRRLDRRYIQKRFEALELAVVDSRPDVGVDRRDEARIGAARQVHVDLRGGFG